MTGADDPTDVNTSGRPHGEDDVLAALLGGSADAPRLSELLAAAAAPPATGPQPGEASALAAFRELVTEPAGIPSLAHRRRARLAVAAASSIVVVLGGGVAAAATGALPDSAQQVAKNVLGAVGVHVPGPADGQHGGGSHGRHHGNGKGNGHTPLPTPTQTPPVTHPTHPTHPTQPTHPTTPADGHPSPHSSAPGNSAWGRSHHSPTPTSAPSVSPSDTPSADGGHGHGKPTAAPTTSRRHSLPGNGFTRS